MLQAERRKRDVRNRLRRATWTARENLGDFIEGFPCNLIGHNWVEVPQLLRVSATSDGKKMIIKCSRCHLCNLT